MQIEDQKTLYYLLAEEPVGTLAVVVQERPVTGLLPFAAAPDLQSLFIHASSLARHTAGLKPGSPFSLLIQVTNSASVDPHQIPRVSLEGQTQVLIRDGWGFAAGREIYLRKFRESEGLFSLQDFNLYQLVVAGGRFIAGFARAYNLSPQSLASIASSFADPE